MIRIRDYEHGDAVTIVHLFFNTIHSINQLDYSVEQVQAWSPQIPDVQVGTNRMIAPVPTLVADQAGDYWDSPSLSHKVSSTCCTAAATSSARCQLLFYQLTDTTLPRGTKESPREGSDRGRSEPS